MKSLIVWRFCDGNRAHEKQTAALLQGLQALFRLDVHNVDFSASGRIWQQRRQLHQQAQNLPRPQLIIAAGHKTHWPLVWAGKRYGGKTVVVMKPSLPVVWFDYAIIPEHDRPKAFEHVIISKGMLNPTIHSEPDDNCGLLLLGGENKYFDWDNDQVLSQVRQVLQSEPNRNWVISNSRRTPADMDLQALAAKGVTVIDWQTVSADWLPQQLSKAAEVWVSCDSMSMIYESLNTAARVGIIRLPVKKQPNKVAANVQKLLDEGLLLQAGEPINEQAMHREPLNEHLRIAKVLAQRLAL